MVLITSSWDRQVVAFAYLDELAQQLHVVPFLLDEFAFGFVLSCALELSVLHGNF